jgi:hypothetical protein
MIRRRSLQRMVRRRLHDTHASSIPADGQAETVLLEQNAPSNKKNQSFHISILSFLRQTSTAV